MKNKFPPFLIGLVAGLAIAVLIILVVVPKSLFTVTESKYDFNETVTLLEESTKTQSWSLPHQYNLQATMTKHGFDVKPVKVFSICKPDLAKRILETDADRHIAAMMPCRIAVFEKSDGKTYIARINARMLSKLLGSNAKSVMSEAGAGSEMILAPLFE